MMHGQENIKLLLYMLQQELDATFLVILLI